jgi:hypothetical protein
MKWVILAAIREEFVCVNITVADGRSLSLPRISDLPRLRAFIRDEVPEVSFVTARQ